MNLLGAAQAGGAHFTALMAMINMVAAYTYFW